MLVVSLITSCFYFLVEAAFHRHYSHSKQKYFQIYLSEVLYLFAPTIHHTCSHFNWFSQKQPAFFAPCQSQLRNLQEVYWFWQMAASDLDQAEATCFSTTFLSSRSILLCSLEIISQLALRLWCFFPRLCGEITQRVSITMMNSDRPKFICWVNRRYY